MLRMGLCFSKSEGSASRSQNSGVHPGGPGTQSEVDLGASFLRIRKLLLLRASPHCTPFFGLRRQLGVRGKTEVSHQKVVFLGLPKQSRSKQNSLLLLQGVLVQSLVGELRSHMQYGKQTNKQNQPKSKAIF